MAGWRYARPFQAAFALSLAGISWLSLTPVPGELPASDKVLHVAGYFALGLLADFAFPDRRYLVKALPLVAYGVIIEAIQARIPGRFAEGADVFANVGGLLLFWVCVPLLRRVPVLRSRWGGE